MLVREPALWRERVRGGFVGPAPAGLSGLEQLRRRIPDPPLSRLTGMRFDGAAPETATFSFPVSGWLAWTAGVVPGGIAAIPGDAALGCALQASLPAGRTYTTAELSLSYVRPLRVGSRVSASARALHVGESLAVSAGDVRDEQDRLLVHATTRCQIFSVDAGHTKGGTAAPPRPSYPEDAGAAPDPYLRALPDPAPSAGAPGATGLELLRAMVAGDGPAPPIHHLIGITPVACAEGSASCAMPMSGWLATPYGWPQGGFIALLADVALALAAGTTCAAGERAVSVDLKVNFLRPVACDGSIVTAAATVVHRGRLLAVANAEVTGADGKRIALATGSSRVLADRTR